MKRVRQVAVLAAVVALPTLVEAGGEAYVARETPTMACLVYRDWYGENYRPREVGPTIRERVIECWPKDQARLVRRCAAVRNESRSEAGKIAAALACAEMSNPLGKGEAHERDVKMADPWEGVLR